MWPVRNKTIIGLKYGIIGDRMTNFNKLEIRL